MRIEFAEADEFKKDFKQLLKKHKTLIADFTTLKKYGIKSFHTDSSDINNNIIKITKVQNTPELQFYKIIRFRSLSFKNHGSKSPLRIIYAYFANAKKVVFLQLYIKSEHQNEDKNRIEKFRKNNYKN